MTRCEWLAREISPDTYVNIMGQYRPQYQVGEIFASGKPKYGDVDRPPGSEEIEAAFAAARRAGLWRFDQRRSLALLR